MATSSTIMKHQDNNDSNPQETPSVSRNSVRTAAFLATEHSQRTLRQISSLEVPVEDLDDDERKMIVESKYNPNTYQSIGVENDKDDADDSDAWYNKSDGDDDDPTIGEFITFKTVVIGICWLASCGMLGYYLLKGYYMLK
jgi:hypothetical protein